MPRLTIYSTGSCPICEQSKKLLTKWHIPYSEIRLDLDSSEHLRYAELTQGARMVPQFLIDGQWIGGFTELTEMHMEEELDALMETYSA